MKVVWGSLIAVILIGCLWKAIDRDTHLIKMFTQDLRNRVVGARLQKDGKDPYFYKWKEEDGLRYYDPNNFDSSIVSNITASPFFHKLMYPIADLPQHKIRIIWLVIQHALLVIMILLGLHLARGIENRLIIIFLSVAVIFTEAWKNLISAGQLYLIIPFFFFLFFFFFRKASKPENVFVSGLLFTVIILIRPNIIIAFIPLLLIVNRFTFKIAVIFLLPVFVFFALLISSKFERQLWHSYWSSIYIHAQYHNGEKILEVNEPYPGFLKWEGMDMADMNEQQKHYGFKSYSEHGNVFVIAKLLFNLKLKNSTLLKLSIISIIICCALFYYYIRNSTPPLINFFIFGFCLYMISDLFSPIHRFQYYTMQWIALLILAGIYFRNTHVMLYMFIFLGLILSIINVPAILMEHTMGEYIWLASFMILSFIINNKTPFSENSNLEKHKI